MPRKTKEQKILESNEEKEKTTKTVTKKEAKTTTTAKKATKKEETKKEPKKSASKVKKASTKAETKAKSTTKSVAKTKKETAKKEATKKTASKKASSAKPKKEDTKKKETSKTAKKATKKTTKSSTKKTTSKAKTAKRKTTSRKKKVEVLEYYDLPYRYNQTVVKVLAQTPTTLFVYWDISDADRKNFEKQFGENFFETTKPVLIIYNDTLGYSFEVEINDFANSWYLHVADSKCDYRIELGRRPIKNERNINIDDKINTEYIHISTSNEIESPNDRILFNPSQKMVYFRDVKTGVTTTKSIKSLSLLRSMGKIYDIYDLYRKMYGNKNVDEIFDLNNPSSGNPSSGSLSSWF